MGQQGLPVVVRTGLNIGTDYPYTVRYPAQGIAASGYCMNMGCGGIETWSLDPKQYLTSAGHNNSTALGIASTLARLRKTYTHLPASHLVCRRTRICLLHRGTFQNTASQRQTVQQQTTAATSPLAVSCGAVKLQGVVQGDQSTPAEHPRRREILAGPGILWAPLRERRPPC